MKPAFALSLSFDGISLLHRCAGGWRNAGEVALDAPDLATSLGGLRGAASRLEPGPLFTKLILPNDQIRYLSLETGAVDGATRDQMVREALAGATPYAVEELAYDISVEGQTTHVAAVARETLAEAEAFAQEHQFGPLCFVAVPGRKPFLGEPFFGVTEHSRSALPPGERVEADGIAVVIVGPAEFPVPGAPPPLAETESVPEMAPEGTAEVAQPPVSEAVSTSPAADQPADNMAPPAAPQPTAEPAMPLGTFSSRRRRVPPKVQPAGADTGDAAAARPTTDPAPSPQIAAAQLRARMGLETTPDPQPTAPIEATPAPAHQPDPQPEAGADLLDSAVPSPISATTAPPQSSAEAPRPLTAERTQPPGQQPHIAPERTLPPLSSVGAKASGLLSGLMRKREGQATAAAQEAAEPAPASRKIDVSAMPARLATAVMKTPKAAAPDAATTAVVDDERQRMTVFGARQPAQPRNKSRYLGLILTAVLLLFLAGVAALASIFQDGEFAGLFGRGDRNAAQSSGPASVSIPDMTAPDPGSQQALETPIQSEEPVTLASIDPASSGLTDTDAAVLEALRNPRAPVTGQIEDHSDQSPETRYAVTGIWASAPPEPNTPSLIGLDDLYLGSIDNRDLSQDAVALPDLALLQTDEPLGRLTSPAAPGVTYDYDERGLVRATPEGAPTPDGYVVYKGRPPAVPPQTPDRSVIEPEPEETLQDRLAGYRPRLRPNDLAERAERAELGGLTRSELAQKRPRPRPAALAARAAEAEAAQVAAAAEAAAREAAQEAEAAEAAQTPDNDISTATRLAVAQAPRPLNRPRDAATRAKRQTPSTEDRNAGRNLGSTAGVTSGGDGRGGEVATIAPRTVKPTGTTRASVSKQATVNNAINLRKVNLIGVYGTPSNRRALVRLPSGRYKKVQVGDTIDGGRISAIGDSELRYRKGGRNLVLKIPSG